MSTDQAPENHTAGPLLGLGLSEGLGALPLTDAQIADVIREATGWQAPHSAFFNLARAIERAHGIGRNDGSGACPYTRATFGAKTQMETKTEVLKTAIEALADKAKAATAAHEAQQFAQAALSLAHAAASLHNMK